MKRWNQIKPSLVLSFSALSAILVIASCAPKNSLNHQSTTSGGTAAPTANAQGGQDAGGGDTNEIRFKEVAGNISAWIRSGNADVIKMSSGITLADYKAKMLQALGNYEVVFVNDAIKVAGDEKTCRNFESNGKPKIECNVGRFAKVTNEGPDEVYKIVHHEFAGFVGAEKNDGANSDYSISNQISAFLQYQVVKRLPVTPVSDIILSKDSKDNVEIANLKDTQFFGADHLYALVKPSNIPADHGIASDGSGSRSIYRATAYNYDPRGYASNAFVIIEGRVSKKGSSGDDKPFFIRISKIKDDNRMVLGIVKLEWKDNTTVRVVLENWRKTDPDESNYIDLFVPYDAMATLAAVHLTEAPKY